MPMKRMLLRRTGMARSLALSMTLALLSQAEPARADDGGYLIVTTNAILNRNSEILTSFVESKLNRGFDVHVVTDSQSFRDHGRYREVTGPGFGGGVGDPAAERIRAWIKGHYLVDNLRYVLLIGDPRHDVGDVPMKLVTMRDPNRLDASGKPIGNVTEFLDPQSPTDYYYAELSGNWDLNGDGKFAEMGYDDYAGGFDYYPELSVGRIPYYGSDVDLQGILAKTIAYENEFDIAWRRSALLAMNIMNEATNGYPWGLAIKNNVLNPAGYSSFHVYPKPVVPDNASLLTADVSPVNPTGFLNGWKSRPFGLTVWLAHGTPNYAQNLMQSGDEGQFTDAYPSIVFQGSCRNADPADPSNLSYSLLRRGAIASLAATKVMFFSADTGVGLLGTYWSTNYAIIDGWNGARTQNLGYKFVRNIVQRDASVGDAWRDVLRVTRPSSHWLLTFSKLYHIANYMVHGIYGDPSLRITTGRTSPLPDAWTDFTVGNPTLRGATMSRDRTITVLAGGNDIWNTADQFRFVGKTSTGPNAELVTYVVGAPTTDGWSKAGLMFRESDQPGARNVFLSTTRDNGVLLQSRVDQDQYSRSEAGAQFHTRGQWLKLVRRGSEFTAYTSEDLSSWIQLGNPVTIPGFAATALGGLAVTAHNEGRIGVASFQNTSIRDILLPAVPSGFAALASHRTITLSWNAAANADGYLISRSTSSSGPFAEIATPTGTQFVDLRLLNGQNYYYQIRSRNADAVSAPASIAASPWTALPLPTGLTASAGDRKVTLSWPWAGPASAYRVERGTSATGSFVPLKDVGTTTYQDIDLVNGTTYWYRLRLINDLQVGNPSATAVSATPKSSVLLPSVPSGIVAKPAYRSVILTWSASSNATSYRVLRSTTSTGTFVEVVNGLTTLNYTQSNLDNGTTVWYKIEARNASGAALSTAVSVVPVAPTYSLSGQDIGNPSPAGSRSTSNGTYTVAASGFDIYGNSDQFGYYSKPFSGDGTAIVRVASITRTHDWAKAGLMIREGLAANAREVMVEYTAQNGAAFQYRGATGGSTTTIPYAGGAVPGWLKLVRSGNLFTGFRSADGINWTKVGEVTLSLPANLNIGLAVTSHQDGSSQWSTLNVSKFDNLLLP
jgi:fibronectin type 3 domain-containing protein